MDAKTAAVASDTNNFEPSSDFIQEEECDTLLLYLPGFTKEQLRVQLARSGVLKISGRRPVGDNKWSSFEKEFRVSANCDANKISARFEGGILYVRQPKLIVPAAKDETKLPPSEIPPPQKPKEELPAPKNVQEQAATQKTTTNGDQIKHTEGKKSPDQSVQKEETKPANANEKEKRSESEVVRNVEKNSEKTESGKDDKKTASLSSSDKRDNISGKTDAKVVNKGSGGNFMAKIDYNKLSSAIPAIPAEKLKMARKTMNMVLVVLLAFGVGAYVSNFIWHSGKSEN